MKTIKKISDWSIIQIHKEYRKWLFLFFLVFCFYRVISAINTANFVLLSTGLAVFWYSIETYYLKQIQQKTLKQQRIRDNFDIMPYLTLDISFSNYTIVIITNKGRGLAKQVGLNIKFNDQSYTKNISAISPGDSIEFDHAKDYEFLNDFGSLRDEEAPTILVKCNFKDIADRKYIMKCGKFIEINGSFIPNETSQETDGWKIGD